jgi:2-haloacid dehalogenase
MQSYVFDAFGTLFDVTRVPASLSAACGSRAAAIVDACRAKQLEYTWVYTLLDGYKDFETLTTEAIDFVLEGEQQLGSEMKQALLDVYRRPVCFPDVRPVLQRLFEQRHRLSILSNGTRSMLDGALQHTGLASYFDEILSVEKNRAYKPSSIAYDAALRRLQIKHDAFAFISSNRWDVAGATRRGFRTIWLNRRNAPDEYLGLPPFRAIASLEELDRC